MSVVVVLTMMEEPKNWHMAWYLRDTDGMERMKLNGYGPFAWTQEYFDSCEQQEGRESSTISLELKGSDGTFAWT